MIWDLGGVLIDWDPRRLFSQLLDDPAEVDRFLAEVCTPAWHSRQDAGRSAADATEELLAAYPERAELARAFYGRWTEMFGGVYPATVDVVTELARAGVRMVGLTNWPEEQFALDRHRYDVLDRLEGIVVSGEERLTKPDPAIYRVVLERFGLDPTGCVYLDDNVANVAVAGTLGMTGVVVAGISDLRRDLAAAGLPVDNAVSVRSGRESDLPELMAIYNHYVEHTTATFDLAPFTDRSEWFRSYADTGRHRLLVALRGGKVVGYATSGGFRAKPAYDHTVETTVYLRPGEVGGGVGSMLYQELFRVLRPADVHLLVAAVALPNEPSLRLHRRFGFTDVGTLPEVGRKHGAWQDVRWLSRRFP